MNVWKSQKNRADDTSVKPTREIYNRQVISSHKTAYKTKVLDECWSALLRRLRIIQEKSGSLMEDGTRIGVQRVPEPSLFSLQTSKSILNRLSKESCAEGEGQWRHHNVLFLLPYQESEMVWRWAISLAGSDMIDNIPSASVPYKAFGWIPWKLGMAMFPLGKCLQSNALAISNYQPGSW